MWLGEEGGLDLLGGVDGRLGTSCPVYMLSHAGGIDGKAAGALAVAFRRAGGVLRAVHRARVNVETVALNNDSKGDLFSGAITLVLRNLF